MKVTKFRLDISEKTMTSLVGMCKKLAHENEFVKVRPAALSEFIIADFFKHKSSSMEEMMRDHFLDRKAFVISKIRATKSPEEELEVLRSFIEPPKPRRSKKTVGQES